MDQNLAKKLLVEGGLLVFLGVPVGTEFGIDMKSWITEERFKGIKMIPPGVHFIFYGAANNVGDISPRSGFFYNFRKGEVIVRKWNQKEDDMSSEETTEQEVVSVKHNIKALDSFLGPYPYDIYEKWTNLTNSMTDRLINRLIPLSGIVRSALELEGCSDADRPRAGKSEVVNDSHNVQKKLRLSNGSVDELESKLLPQMKAKEGTDLRFIEFPDKPYPLGSNPSDITRHSLDSSYLLETMISKYEQPTDLIGELQFSFICFLVGHSLEAFERWKKLVILFCSCESAITKHRKLYDLLLNVLREQIVEIPEEFLADIVSNNNFFYMKIRHLFRNIENSNVDGQLKSKMSRFKEFLTTQFLWQLNDLDEEDEEDAPVVVNIE